MPSRSWLVLPFFALSTGVEALGVAKAHEFPQAPIVVPSASPLGERSSQGILGRWQDEEHGAVVEVSEDAGTFTGRIVSTPLPGVKKGLTVFVGLKFEAKKDHWIGEVYAPRRNKKYRATYRVEGRVLSMKVTFGPLWKTVRWFRVVAP